MPVSAGAVGSRRLLRTSVKPSFLGTPDHDHSLLDSIPARTLILHDGAIRYDGAWPP